MIDFIYCDESVVVAIKPSGILSTDEEGGMPELVRDEIRDSCILTVHRLDRVVSGIMVLARSKECASELSRQIRDHEFKKEYLAVTHGRPTLSPGSFSDLLIRSKQERKTYITDKMSKGVQDAVLDYSVLESINELSLVDISLRTGRTHQIRCQFSAHGLPIVGDRKYGSADDECNIALWSFKVSFKHPITGKLMRFSKLPPNFYPWSEFDYINNN